MNPGRRKKPGHRKRRRIMPVDRFRVNCAGRKKPVQFITLGKAGKPVADKADSGKMKGVFGRCGIRTHRLCLRRATLYPNELIFRYAVRTDIVAHFSFFVKNKGGG